MLGEAFGETKRDVFDKLIAEHPNANEIRIKTLGEPPTTYVAAAADREYGDAPRLAPTRITLDNIEHAFTHQPWNADQQTRGAVVTAALIHAARMILQNVPESPTRTRAMNNLIDARMLANAAITHDGRY